MVDIIHELFFDALIPPIFQAWLKGRYARSTGWRFVFSVKYLINQLRMASAWFTAWTSGPCKYQCVCSIEAMSC